MVSRVIDKRQSEVIFVHQNLISNRLTYLVRAKSTGELIGFGFSDRSVRINLSEMLSKRLIQKLK